MNKVKGSDGRQYKSVNIKGKEYVEVSERVKHFHDMYADKAKSITTEILHYYQDKGLWVVRATVQVGDDVYTGLAQELEGVGMVNSTSALENAETSAIGRALGFLNIGVVDGIASVDEINKANNRSKRSFKSDSVDYNPEIHGTVKVGYLESDKFRQKVKEFEAQGGGYDGEQKIWFLPKDVIEKVKQNKN